MNATLQQDIAIDVNSKTPNKIYSIYSYCLNTKQKGSNFTSMERGTE